MDNSDAAHIPQDVLLRVGAGEGAGDSTPARISPQLCNEDLAPLRHQTWGSYNFLAFWMSDVHSVGGYVFAGSLFALGLASWQVLVALIVGIILVNILCNLIARPSQKYGIPYPVFCRAVFGVWGANVAALIRGLIAITWYGIQTFLASSALVVVLLHFLPQLAPYANARQHGFMGLSLVGWAGFMTLWSLQALLFWHGMEAIKRFIDLAGPAVYVVMLMLAGYMTWRAGLGRTRFALGEVRYHGLHAVSIMLGAIALVVSYFSGPMLNFGDFSRYGKDFRSVKLGNFLGLPVNFIAFSLIAVLITSATIPVFGRLITDPVATVGLIDSPTAVILGALTFITATIGINIVANFVSAAFDFSNLAPQYITWRTGGMLAAVASIFITPWNLFNKPEVIHYTIDILGCFIGPLYGILVADFYLMRRGTIHAESLYTTSPEAAYWYRGGVNPAALAALLLAAAFTMLCVFAPPVKGLQNLSWFIGAFLGGLFHLLASKKQTYVAQAHQS